MGGCGRSNGGGENSAGTGISVHSFYRYGHIAAMCGSGVHRAQNTHSSPNTSGDSRGRLGRSVHRRADGCRSCSKGGLNRAESSDDESFNPSRNGRGGRGPHNVAVSIREVDVVEATGGGRIGLEMMMMMVMVAGLS